MSSINHKMTNEQRNAIRKEREACGNYRAHCEKCRYDGPWHRYLSAANYDLKRHIVRHHGGKGKASKTLLHPPSMSATFGFPRW